MTPPFAQRRLQEDEILTLAMLALLTQNASNRMTKYNVIAIISYVIAND